MTLLVFSCVQHNYLLASKGILNENFGRGYGERTGRGFSVLSCWWRSGRVTGLNDSLQQVPLSSVDDIWDNRPHWRGHALREANQSLALEQPRNCRCGRGSSGGAILPVFSSCSGTPPNAGGICGSFTGPHWGSDRARLEADRHSIL